MTAPATSQPVSTEPPTPEPPATAPPTTPVAPDDVLPAPLHRVLGITDGDTIDVEIDGIRTRLRIIGVDTPERGECGYQEASSAMQSLVQSRQVRLEADETQADADRYDRLLRHVFTEDGVNVAEEIIARGLGVEYTYAAPYRYRDDYLAAQSAAQEGNLGLWGDLCLLLPIPSAPLTEAPVGVAPRGEATAEGDCLIKGNINREGEQIYHRPGQRDYEKTVINEGAGERWFCTPEEAEAAGWRPARR